MIQIIIVEVIAVKVMVIKIVNLIITIHHIMNYLVKYI